MWQLKGLSHKHHVQCHLAGVGPGEICISIHARKHHAGAGSHKRPLWVLTWTYRAVSWSWVLVSDSLMGENHMSFSGRVLCFQCVRGPGFAPQYYKQERILLLWYHGQVAQDFM